jgi:molybdopterin converting factor small subunit
MPIRVEFFGIARQRAGRAALDLELGNDTTTLGGVLTTIGRQVPEFARECLVGGTLVSTLAANLDGQQFVSDPATPICDGQALLILSADAGG